MSDEGGVLLEKRHGHVLLLTMNRPERHHALNRELTAALGAAVERAEHDPDVRVIVLTGSGERAFCAGADMLEMSGVEASSRPAPAPSRDGGTGRFLTTPIPVIAAVNGYCYGGGASLAISCDIRLASESATFRLPGTEYGLVVAAATLPRLVGSSKAKELIFTARRFTAAEALAWGLVSAVYPQPELLAAALALAQEIAGHSVAAVRGSKRVIDAATLSSAALELEAETNRALRGSPEQSERFRSATRRVTGR
ncbi:MAG: enoyl-CoA hydratase/isomerase family protein [Chloroflexi bacterium]|nr:enoyl-CoA hydratase/isomerase family protein [Chloroflexota bacterium]